MCITIGIDKTSIKGFEIKTIDMNRLLTRQNVILQLQQQESQPCIILEGVEGHYHNICYLKITDGHMFNTFMLGIKIKNGHLNNYCILDMSIAEGTDSNLRPLLINEYHNKIARLKSYLEDIYGLYVNFDNARFNSLELNITAQMDYDFVEYQYLLNTMCYLTPRVYKYTPDYDKDRIIREYKFYNNSTSGKIYDKTYQLMDRFKIKVEDQYMRIEYTLTKTESIEKTLGTSSIYNLEDNTIKTWLVKKITRDLINPTQRYIHEKEKELYKLGQEEKATGSKNWCKNFIIKAMSLRNNIETGDCPVVIDLNQLEKIIRKLTNPAHAARNIQRLKPLLSNYRYAEGNIKKFEEVINKFTQL